MDYLVTGEVQKIRENGATSGVGVLATYAYDNLGNRTSVAYGNGTSTTYSYDPVSRLTSLTNDLAGTGSDLTIGSISYNPASQITTQTRSNDAYAWTGHGNGSTATVTNGLNELASVGGVAAAYDTKGNLTSDPTTGRSYVYTAENRLATSAGTNLIYDPLGRLYGILSGRILDYDGADMVLETDQPTGTVTYSRYVFAPGEDQPIVWYEGSGTTDRRFLHTDERGSIVAASDGSGALLNIDTYDEYGKPGASNNGRFQYTGQMWVPELGLYSYKARDYVPQLGVFAEPDPIGQDGGPNLYAYVGGDPVNQADPTGLCTPYVTSIGASPVISGCRLEDAPRFSSGGPLISPGERNGGCVGDCRPIVVNAPRKPLSRQCSSHPILNALGIINALPASAITATFGVLGSAAGTFAGTHPYARFGNNALQFRNIPFVSRAFTFGNVTIYGLQNPGNTTLYDSYTGRVSLALHEEAHTKQSEILGPGGYFVSHLMLGIGSGSNPLEQRADAYARGQSCTGF